MTARAPFTLAVIQDGVEATAAETLVATEARIRAAHAKGAQVICLKELFNAPYFCKRLDASRFDLAEPVDGPTVTRLQAVARELAVVLVVPFYERQAAGVYRNSAAVIDADGTLLGVYRKMHIPHDPLFEEKYYFAPGESDRPVQPAGARGPDGEAGGFMVWKTRYATIGVLMRGGPHSARTRSPTASTLPHRTAPASSPRPARTASSSSDTPSSAIRTVAMWRRRRRGRRR